MSANVIFYLFCMLSGEQATRMVVADGRRVAEACSGPARSELLRLCDETEILCNQLSDLIAKGQGNSPQAKAIARHLSEKLQALKGKIQDALVSQVRKCIGHLFNNGLPMQSD